MKKLLHSKLGASLFALVGVLSFATSVFAMSIGTIHSHASAVEGYFVGSDPNDYVTCQQVTMTPPGVTPFNVLECTHYYPVPGQMASSCYSLSPPITQPCGTQLWCPNACQTWANPPHNESEEYNADLDLLGPGTWTWASWHSDSYNTNGYPNTCVVTEYDRYSGVIYYIGGHPVGVYMKGAASIINNQCFAGSGTCSAKGPNSQPHNKTYSPPYTQHSDEQTSWSSLCGGGGN